MDFGSLFTGSNPTLKNDIAQTGGLASFLNNTGTKDTATASTFMNTLLSGNSGDVSKLLSPQIEGIQSRNQQQKQQLGEFGGRSGGTTAAMLKSDDDVHAQINDLIAKLTGTAATNLGTMGSTLLNEGANALNSQAAMSQEQLKNQQGGIFGNALGQIIGSATGFGLGKLFPAK